MMKFAQRLATSVVVVAALAYLIFRASPVWFTAVLAAFIGAGLFEFFTMLRARQVPSYRLFGVSIGLVIPVVVFLESGVTRSGEVLFIVLACLFLFLLQFSRKNNSEALVGISLTLFGMLYVSWFSSFLLKIRFLSGGPIWVAYLIAVTKSSDVGAYVFGSLFGRHPLMPHVSPNKSVEGMVGGLALSVVVSTLLGPCLPVKFEPSHLAVLGAMIGVIGQIGDLSESLMKRFCDTKDSGALLPGMGGVLDVMDSILFTAPLFYFHLSVCLK